MRNEDKAKEIAQRYFPNELNIWARDNVEAMTCAYACTEMAKWKDEKFNDLLESELKRWSKVNDSCEAKYRLEMLKELIEKLNGNEE